VSKNLAIIPARRGSKRLPGKNTKLFLGRPLILWTIDVAMSSSSIDEIVVSSDCIDTLEIAKGAGVTELHLRSAATSSDEAKMQEVISETLNYLGGEKVSSFSCLALLQPTSPLRSPVDVERSFELFTNYPDTDCVISYTQRPQNLGDSKRISILKDGYVDAFPVEMRKIDSNPVYIRNGPAICLSKLPQAQSQLLHGKIRGYEMPFIRSLDIDSQTDFLIAEAIGRYALNI